MSLNFVQSTFFIYALSVVFRRKTSEIYQKPKFFARSLSQGSYKSEYFRSESNDIKYMNYIDKMLVNLDL